ncbi:hypothetical protein [Streptomyces abyssomicinicus]|uniref:hypothetical protein n=1 Tax=Streptomyces abyssomicinicus TaxID=574929 RepID=UPI00124FF001|nr:hypothetical protein [Streptomyces abyssomicinicus]
MTKLRFADQGEAADLCAFLSRLLHYDRAAAVRLQGAGEAVAVYGSPASFEVLAVRAVRLAEPVDSLDVTVSAGELLEAVGEEAGGAAAAVVPEAVTGPSWAGLLPPRGGWRAEESLPGETLRGLVAAAVAEFRRRVEEIPPQERTRAELDRTGRQIWARTVDGTGLPVRAVHAAQSLGFLRPGAHPQILSCGSWLRLRTPYGSVAVRRAGRLGGLGVGVA